MRGVRFYLEYDSPKAKRQGIHNGNVFALLDVMGNGFKAFNVGEGYGYEGIGAVLFYPNSPVAGTSVSVEYLRQNTKRISERIARQIHPLLFERLDSGG